MTEISDVSAGDLDEVTECYRLIFRHSLSSTLGKAYTRKSLEWFLTNGKNTFLFIIRKSEKCAGLCGGILVDGKLETGSASGMIQHAFREAFLSVLLRPWVLLHPAVRSRMKFKLILSNIARKLKLGPKSGGNPRPIRSGNSKHHIGLTVIGVSPEFRHLGLGTTLLNEFEGRARRLKSSRLALSVASKNHSAIAFYHKHGWEVAGANGEELHMEKRLP